MQPSPHYDNAVAFVPLWARVRGFRSRATAVQDCHLVVAHLHRLGFVINKEKSVLCPSQITHFLGMFLDSTSMEIRLSRERINAIKICVLSVSTGTVSLVAVLPTPVGNDGVNRYRAPARVVAYAAVPDVVPVYEAQRSHRQAPQSNGVLQMQEGPGNLENPLVSRCLGHYGHSVALRSSGHRRLHQGWGAVCEGRGVNGLWSVREAVSHINVLELRTVVLALRHFLPRLSGQHVLVRTDNTATLAYINRQGGVCSQSLHHWANRLLLWAAIHVFSLRAVHIPGHFNYGADLLSRGDPRAADWCLHPQVIQQIWTRSGRRWTCLRTGRIPAARSGSR